MLILVRIPLASVLVLALARNFFVCTISYEPVIGFLHNLNGYIVET